MKEHNGMRPHDIAILLKIASKKDAHWYMKDLAQELYISASEVSESIHRSMIAGLIGPDKRRLMKSALLNFLEHGLPYVYPVRAGTLVSGLPTAHSAKPLSNEILSDESLVWPFKNGTVRGQAIEPLHKHIPKACLLDALFYEYMALCDALRVGKVRERNLAMDALRERLL